MCSLWYTIQRVSMLCATSTSAFQEWIAMRIFVWRGIHLKTLLWALASPMVYISNSLFPCMHEVVHILFQHLRQFEKYAAEQTKESYDQRREEGAGECVVMESHLFRWTGFCLNLNWACRTIMMVERSLNFRVGIKEALSEVLSTVQEMWEYYVRVDSAYKVGITSIL